MNPHAEYTQRRDHFRDESARLRRFEQMLSVSRLAAFIATLLLLWLAFGVLSIPRPYPAAAAVLFVVLVIAHDRIIRRRQASDRIISFYEHGLARLEDRWHGLGDTGETYRNPDHLYADDLDLFGERSLFQLLCTAKTSAGRQTLAEWLLQPAPASEIAERQEAVQELKNQLELREDIARIGEDVAPELDPDALCRWAEKRSPLESSPLLRIGLASISALSIGTLGLWILTPAGPLPLLLALVLQASIATMFRGRVQALARGITHPTRDLGLLRRLLERLEAESFRAPYLARCCEALHHEEQAASKRIGELERLTNLLEARQNQLFAPIAALFLWGTQFSLAIAHWKKRWGPRIPEWIEAAGKVEALNSLAAYHYEHPADPFPEIANANSPAILDARALGHPLIPDSECTRNDLSLGEPNQMLLVSGSNMSGKSTLLRALGVNAVLAFAGGAVRAEELRISTVRVAASIHVFDSLADGKSRFYAEILRLRQILDECSGPLPVFFLLDEVLHGTNSHDRRIGAAAIVRELLAQGAIGLVTTHDLALSQLEDEPGNQVQNVHFEDQVEDGEIRFDYKLRPGVVTKSNALDLMRAIGLRV